MTDKLAPWKINTRHTAFETPWFRIQKQHMTMPSGKELDYFIHDTDDSVICICVTPDNKLLVEQQYRPPVEKISFDYPAGKREKDDATTEAAILRELREETGFQVTSLRKIAVIDKEPAFSKTRMHVFLAKGSVKNDAQPEETESILVNFFSPQEILAMITSEKMTCTFCISATFLAFYEMGWLKTDGL